MDLMTLADVCIALQVGRSTAMLLVVACGGSADSTMTKDSSIGVNAKATSFATPPQPGH